jgi:diguanylate cyclase
MNARFEARLRGGRQGALSSLGCLAACAPVVFCVDAFEAYLPSLRGSASITRHCAPFPRESETLVAPGDIANIALRRMADLGIAPTPDNFARFYRDTEATLKLAAPLAEAFRMHSDASTEPAPAVPATPVAPAALPGQPPATWNVTLDQFTRRLDHATAALVAALDRRAAAERDTAQPAAHAQAPAPQAAALAPGWAGSERMVPPAALPREVRTLIERMDAATVEIRDELQASRAELGETRNDLKTIRDQLNEARDAVQHDPLTGVLNRRGMDIVLPREVARARRVNAPLSVGMVDLDHFKHINDTFGHQAGDRVLIHMTELMRSVLRETDLLVRYGGEEFLVILPDTDMQGARLVLDRLQEIVVKSPVIHEGRRITVGFSAGVAQFRDDDNGATLILRADRALASAKRGGRSQVVMAES